MAIVAFDPAHCRGASAHPSQAHYQDRLDDPTSFRDWWPQTVSAFGGDELVAIGGLVRVEGALAGWALFTDKITPARFVAIHRTVARFLARLEQTGGTIFVHVDPDNRQAARWAGLLGLQARCIDVMPDGREMTRMVAA